jgi:hypothetical protein
LSALVPRSIRWRGGEREAVAVLRVVDQHAVGGVGGLYAVSAVVAGIAQPLSCSGLVGPPWRGHRCGGFVA